MEYYSAMKKNETLSKFLSLSVVLQKGLQVWGMLYSGPTFCNFYLGAICYRLANSYNPIQSCLKQDTTELIREI